ncbi:hypothetical protein CRUP_011022, partial [Coryphaenoides rupestris]
MPLQAEGSDRTTSYEAEAGRRLQWIRRKRNTHSFIPPQTWVPRSSQHSSASPNDSSPRAELVRREEVARRSLFVKVLYNDKE